MMKIIDEIRAVGFKDWCWFVFVLKRNEFSPRLNLFNYHERYKGEDWITALTRDRERAHEIDLILLDLERKKRAA